MALGVWGVGIGKVISVPDFFLEQNTWEEM